MPKKAVAIFFLLAFLGAAIFVFFTFPRTKEEIPQSNNQRPYPSAPGPNGVPVPEPAPHPTAPHVPPGPTLRVMAWAAGGDTARLTSDTDAFAAGTGRAVSLTLDSDPASYRRDLQAAFASGNPPDVCLVSARDFCGLDPNEDLAETQPRDGTPPRAVEALSSNGTLRAVPAEFSVEVLFYNPAIFDHAGIAYPGRHWTWDVLEADARALATRNLKDDAGHPVVPVELPADFDFWNVLSAEAGAPVLDGAAWHLNDVNASPFQLRGLSLIHELFQAYSITPPLSKNAPPLGQLFARQRAALLVAPSSFAATLPPDFRYGLTYLPRDVSPATVAQVNGWAVPVRSTQASAALSLADYLAYRPVHAGWTSIEPPGDEDSTAAVCHQSLTRALTPRIGSTTARFADMLDGEISVLAHTYQQTPDATFTKIQSLLQTAAAPPDLRQALPNGTTASPTPKMGLSSQVRGL